MNKKTNNDCPCGSGFTLDKCCLPYISGQLPAPTPQALMRSRYTAYCLHNTQYILTSWHASTRPDEVTTDELSTQWIKLKIVACEKECVEFIATYRINGKAHKLHETSQFSFEEPHWFYLNGQIHTS